MADGPPKNDSGPNGRTDENNQAKQETDGGKRVTTWKTDEKGTLH